MNLARCLGATVLAASVMIAMTQGVSAKKPAATPAPSAGASGAPASGTPAADASGSPAPLPTASPEPPQIAIPRLEALVKANPNDRDALGQLSSYYLEVGRPDLAITATQRLIALGQKTVQVYYLDGVANRQLGRTKEAIADFEQASNLDPTNSDVLGTLTSLYIDANRPADAERTAKRATKFNPNDEKAYENYGAVLEAEKRYDDARAQFDLAAKVAPKDASPLVLEAQAYLRQDAPALASTLYDRALAVDPKNPDAILGKARLLASEHDVKGSIALYEELAPLVPTDDGKVALMIEEARLYSQEKMMSDAENELKKAVAAYPKTPAVYIAYGDFEVGQKDIAGAERQWLTAAQLDDKNPDALQRLGDLYTSQNKRAQALDEFHKLTNVVPNNPQAWTEYGQALAIQRQFQGARDAYRRSFEIDHTPTALAGLGASDFELHSYKECGQVFDAIDHAATDYLRQNPQLYLVMGSCYKNLAQRDKAKSAYTRLLALVKPNTDAHRQIEKLIDGLGSSSAHSAPKTASTPKPKH